MEKEEEERRGFAEFLLERKFHLTALEFHRELSSLADSVPKQLQDWVHEISLASSPPDNDDDDNDNDNDNEKSPSQSKEKEKEREKEKEKEKEKEVSKEEERRSREGEFASVVRELTQKDLEISRLKGELSEFKAKALARTASSKSPLLNASSVGIAPRRASFSYGNPRPSFDSPPPLLSLPPSKSLDSLADEDFALINHLVKEYLLEKDYKLTALTFDDEAASSFSSSSSSSVRDSSFSLPLLYCNFYSSSLPSSGNNNPPPPPPPSNSSNNPPASSSELMRRLSELQSKVKSLEEELLSKSEALDASQNRLRSLESLSSSLPSPNPNPNPNPNSNSNSNSNPPSNPNPNDSTSPIGGISSSSTKRELYYEKEAFGLGERLQKFEEKISALTSTICEHLPSMIQSVHKTKREVLLPLILCSIEMAESSSRDELMHHLFNLIKRPDATQRKIIIRGCIELAQRLSSEAVFSELLPQATEQLSHKNAERRCLVAETCGSLAPYLPLEDRRSFLVSMLKQLLEDPSPLVREAVTLNLAALVDVLHEDTDSFEGLVKDSLFKLLFDPVDTVCEQTLNALLPRMVLWAKSSGSALLQHFAQMILAKIHLYLASDATSTVESENSPSTSNSTSGRLSALAEKRSLLLLTAFLSILPSLRSSDDDDSRWLHQTGVPSLLLAVVSLPLVNEKPRQKLVAILSSLAQLYGLEVHRKVIHHQMKLALQTTSSFASAALSLHDLRSRLLPVYFCLFPRL